MKFALIPLLFLILLSVSCDKEDDEKKDELLSKEQMLAGEISKRWKLVQMDPDDDEHLSCRIESVRNTDNFWIFNASGSFQYDNGEIVEDPSCGEEEDCCGDLADLYGTWEFYDNEAKLRIHIVGRIDGTVYTPLPEDEQLDLMAATILLLTKNELEIQQDPAVLLFEPAP